MEKQPKSSGRGRLVVIEIVLLVGTLWMLIWSPLGQGLSVAVSLVMAMLFIGLFPAMLKGGHVADAEREHIARRFSQQDDNKYR